MFTNQEILNTEYYASIYISRQTMKYMNTRKDIRMEINDLIEKYKNNPTKKEYFTQLHSIYDHVSSFYGNSSDDEVYFKNSYESLVKSVQSNIQLIRGAGVKKRKQKKSKKTKHTKKAKKTVKHIKKYMHKKKKSIKKSKSKSKSKSKYRY